MNDKLKEVFRGKVVNKAHTRGYRGDIGDGTYRGRDVHK
jgi:hypothetical protein